MPDNVYVLDEGIFDQINQGNVDLATFISRLRRTEGVELWTSRYVSDQLARTPALSRLEVELQLRAPTQDNIPPYSRIADRVSPTRPAQTAAMHLAVDKGAILITLDRKFAARFRAAGGKTAIEMETIVNASQPFNYNLGRRLLGLRPLNISNDNGKIYPPNQPAPQPAQQYQRLYHPPSSMPPAARPDRPPRLTEGRGEPVGPIRESGPSAVGNAKFQLARLALEVANWIIQILNDRVQRERFEEKWATIKSGVEETLAADPQQGALILVFYSRRQKVGAEKDSPLEHTKLFRDIAVAYGQTREDALRRYNAKTTLVAAGPGEQISDDSLFIPPQLPVDVTKLSTPFPAAGLATFAAGREEFCRVAFGGILGFRFPKTWATSDAVDVPKGVTVRFLYLWPPSELSYMDGVLKTTSVEWGFHKAGETAQDLGPFYPGVPAVSLSGLSSPAFNTDAVMVFPADNLSMRIFKTTRATRDNNDQLKAYGIGLMRWVLPANMRVLRLI